MPWLKKFTPSVNLSGALKTIQHLNSLHISGSLSYLPIKKTKQAAIEADDVVQYQLALEKIERQKLDCDTTLKLHQFGLYGGRHIAEKTITSIVKTAKMHGNFVWIDMERKRTAADTLKLFAHLKQEFGNVGICLQAYLKRTEEDLVSMLKLGARIRLVKGFYRDNEFPNWKTVTENYRGLMRHLIKHGNHPAIATHDLALIEEAQQYMIRYEKPATELQFFYGVRDEMAARLAREGHHVRIYVPYGHLWKFLWYGRNDFDIKRTWQRLRKQTIIK